MESDSGEDWDYGSEGEDNHAAGGGGVTTKSDDNNIDIMNFISNMDVSKI